jgi:hypothetical protein
MLQQKEKKVLDKYIDPTGELTNKQLQWSDWYVRHKILLHKLFIWSSVAVSGMLLVYGIGGLLKYFIFDIVQDRQLYDALGKSYINFEIQKNKYAPQELQISPISIFSYSEGKYDFASIIKNPNPKFIAEIKYLYNFKGGQTNKQSIKIMPNSQIPATILGYPSESYPTDTTLNITEIAWSRINPHKLSDVEKYVSERMQFKFNNLSFKPISAAENRPSNIIELDIYNESNYSYWNPPFYIELLNGAQTVGVLHLSIEKFLAGETRHIDLRNTLEQLDVTDIKLYPNIDLFDESVYMEPQLEEKETKEIEMPKKPAAEDTTALPE